MITYFKTINDTSTPYHVDVGIAIERIKNGKSKDLVEAVRNETEKDKRNEKKKRLPVYVNEISLIWSDMDNSDTYKPAVKPMIRVDDTNEITRRLSLWWQKNYGMIPGQRNNNLYILACAFNEFGVDINTARSIIDSYDVNGEMAREIPTLIESAYRNTAIHNTKFYEDIDKTVAIKNDIKVGMPLDKVAEVYNDVPADVIEQISSEENPNNFWTKSSKGKIDLVPHLLRD